MPKQASTKKKQGLKDFFENISAFWDKFAANSNYDSKKYIHYAASNIAGDDIVRDQIDDDNEIELYNKIEANDYRQETYISGKKVYGQWTETVLMRRQGNAYAADTHESTKEGNQEEVNELMLKTKSDNQTGKEKDTGKQKSAKVDIELEMVKGDPVKSEAVVKARARMKEFMEKLDKVTAQRLEAAMKQNSMVMRLMLEEELKSQGLMAGGTPHQLQRNNKAVGVSR